MKGKKVLLYVSLALILFGSLFASIIQTNFCSVTIKDIRISAEDGSQVSALLYIPNGVDADNKAPGVITCEGYLNSREMQTCFSVEYARRGYVVLAIDMYGHGRSSTEVTDFQAMVPAIAYMQALNFVDSENIGLEGHSKGGLAATLGALPTPGSVKSILAVGSGLCWPALYGVTMDVSTPINYGTIFGKYDEFGWLFWPEEQTEHKDVSAYAAYSSFMKAVWGEEGDSVKPFEWYGEKADNTLRILYQPAETHPFNHVSAASTGYAMNFMNNTLEGGNKAGLADNNQIWYWKEICTGIGMVGFLLFLFAFGAFIIDSGKNTEYLATLPEAKAKLSPRFGILLVIGAAIPALTYKAFMQFGSRTLLPLSRVFPQEMASQTATWALLNGLIALALFLILYFVFGKKEGDSIADWGIKVKFSKVWRHILWGLEVALVAYALLYAVDFFFKVDFRFWLVGFMPLTLPKFQALCAYFLFFAVYTFINSLVLNATYRFAKGSCHKTALLSVLANIGGMLVLLLIGYGTLIIGGSFPFASTDWSLLFIVAIPFLLTLSVAALINTYFFKKTGAVYMGSMLSALFLTFAVVGNTCFQFLF